MLSVFPVSPCDRHLQLLDMYAHYFTIYFKYKGIKGR
jgi:hypothetical protein